jgi:succinoglycan biosynthesis transport protein ExoP
VVEGEKSLMRAPRIEGPLSQVAVTSSFGTEPNREESLFEIIWRQRRTVVLSGVVCLSLCLAYLFVATPVYDTVARIQVHRAGPALLQESPASDPMSETFLNTQAEIVRSAPVLALALAQPGMEDLEIFDGVRNRVTFLKRNLRAEAGSKDDIVTVSLESAYPDDAVKVVGEVVNAFISYQSQEKRDTAAEMLEVLHKEKEKRESELKDKLAEIRAFQREHPQLAYDRQQGGVTNQNLKRLSESLTEAHINTITAQSAYEEAMRSSGLTEADLEGVLVVSASEEQRLHAQLFDQQQRLSEMRQQYMDGHPLVVNAERRVRHLHLAIVAAIRQRWVAARQYEESLRRSLQEEQQRAVATNAATAELARLMGELERIQASRDTLDNRIKELSVIESSMAFNIRVMEPAFSTDDPVKPKKAQYAAIALIGGLVLGAGLGLLREWLDPRLQSAEDMKTALGLNILGVIPRMPQGRTPEANGWVVHLDPMSEAAEACRAIRTAIVFGVPAGRARTILVTSPATDDGKSTIASNLGIALAKAGKRVLVLDANFRSPGMHRIFGVSNELGTATVVEGGCPIEKAIRGTAIERLDVLPTGEVPADPSEMLNSTEFANILEGLAMAYDHVVIDSPAVANVDDARIVAANCDVTLLVLRAERSNRKMAENARDGLVNVGANLMGVIVNDVVRWSPRGLLGMNGGPFNALTNTNGTTNALPQSDRPQNGLSTERDLTRERSVAIGPAFSGGQT